MSLKTVSSFINSKYKCWYDALMLKAKSRSTLTGYTERHHVLPRSLGGTDDHDNIVILTGREHFIAHFLLFKMTRGYAKWKMTQALKLMSTTKKNPQRYVPRSAAIFEAARMALSGPTPPDVCKKISSSLKGWPTRKDTASLELMKQRQSISQTGRTATPETCLKMNMTRKGVPRPKEVVQKVAISQLGKYVAPEVGQKISIRLRSSYKVRTPTGEIFITDNFKAKCKELGLPYDTIMRSFRTHQPVLRGPHKGWQIMEKLI